jgi:hypothetical protein
MRIRDLFDPGSGINIPDSQHCKVLGPKITKAHFRSRISHCNLTSPRSAVHTEITRINSVSDHIIKQVTSWGQVLVSSETDKIGGQF